MGTLWLPFSLIWNHGPRLHVELEWIVVEGAGKRSSRPGLGGLERWELGEMVSRFGVSEY